MLFRIFGLIFFLIVTGCSAVTYTAEISEESSPSRQKSVPFELQVTKEVRQYGRIVLEAELESRADWLVSDIALCCRTFKGSEESGRFCNPLSYYLGNSQITTLEADSITAFPVQFSDDNEETYQISLLWGEEARGVMSKDEKKAGLAVERVKVIRRLKCKGESCVVLYSLQGEIYNYSDRVIQKAFIHVSFVPVDGKESPVELDEEKGLEIGDLELQPEDSVPFEINVDQEISEEDSLNLVPLVSVIEAD